MAIPLDLAAHRLMLEEVLAYAEDELFTDLSDLEFMLIVRHAMNMHNESEHLSISQAAQLITQLMVNYIEDFEVESISVQDLLNTLKKQN